MKYPFIPGRYAIGQVTEADEDSFIKKSERVYLAGISEDEEAPDGLKIAGETSDGFYRDFVLAGVDDVYPLPASVTDEAAFLIDAIAQAEHVIDEMHIEVGQHILVIGGGLYGFWGIFLGVPFMAVVQMLITDYIAARENKEPEITE